MSTPENKVFTVAEARAVLSTISFEKSCIDLGFAWDLEPVADGGFKLRSSFQRPDRDTGALSRGFGRWWLVETGTTESGLVKTAWLSVKQIVEHELMEAFKVQGRRPFDPHRTIDELVGLAEIPR